MYRPRVVLHGDVGMGQSYVGPALLHHLEGFHVQTLDLGSLMGDSTRVRFYFLFVLSLSSNYLSLDYRGGNCTAFRRSQAAPTVHCLYPFFTQLVCRSHRNSAYDRQSHA